MSDSIKGRATKIIIELPFPSKELSPNARVHHQERATATKHHRGMAAAETRLKYNLSEYSGNLICRRYFYEPDRRNRDIDNMGAMCKAYQDGIFEALGLDDKMIVEVRNRRMKPEKGFGRVVFEIFADGEEDD